MAKKTTPRDVANNIIKNLSDSERIEKVLINVIYLRILGLI